MSESKEAKTEFFAYVMGPEGYLLVVNNPSLGAIEPKIPLFFETREKANKFRPLAESIAKKANVHIRLVKLKVESEIETFPSVEKV